MAEEKALRETWRDWLDPTLSRPRTITRKELLGQLLARGVMVNGRKLHYWETSGALPAAVRDDQQWGGPSTYPEWYGEVVISVDHALKQRTPCPSMPELRPIAREAFAAVQRGWGWPGPLQPELPKRLQQELQRFAAAVDPQIALIDLRLVDFTDKVVANYPMLTPQVNSFTRLSDKVGPFPRDIVKPDAG